jgi:membrane-associated protease RseP (regulator of RpoE activity)
MNRWKLTLMIAALMFATAAIAGESRSIGLTFSGDREGFFLDPIMKRVYVSAVVDKSLAGMAGFLPKDEILEIEGARVPGMRARALMDYWAQVSSRRVIHFVISRSGTRMSIDLSTQAQVP